MSDHRFMFLRNQARKVCMTDRQHRHADAIGGVISSMGLSIWPMSVLPDLLPGVQLVVRLNRVSLQNAAHYAASEAVVNRFVSHHSSLLRQLVDAFSARQATDQDRG